MYFVCNGILHSMVSFTLKCILEDTTENLHEQNSLFSVSNAVYMACAKLSASSLLVKLSPYTWRLSRHWWNVGVAWLYFSDLNIEQLTTTWSEMNNTHTTSLITIFHVYLGRLAVFKRFFYGNFFTHSSRWPSYGLAAPSDIQPDLKQ